MLLLDESIFTLEELASYLQVDTIATGTGSLLRDLTHAVVIDAVGSANLGNPRVKPIALEVAARAYRNTNGYQSETVDDYTYRRASGTGAAGVYLTADERASLVGIRTGLSGRVRSVRLTTSYDG